MSMIGDFGVCRKQKWDEVRDLIQKGNFAEAENGIKDIYSEVERSAEKLDNGKCSGEVFIALFDFFETVFEVNVRDDPDCFGEKWRDATGDLDIIVFCEKEQILSLEDTVDVNELTQFINDFYQMDYGNAGQIACNVLFNNLKSVGEDNVLIWHLF